jgi:hypothetical protein
LLPEVRLLYADRLRCQVWEATDKSAFSAVRHNAPPGVRDNIRMSIPPIEHGKVNEPDRDHRVTDADRFRDERRREALAMIAL